MSDWMKWASDTASYAKQAASQATTMVAGTELDKKLAEATTNEPWGASSTLLSEIARATFGYEDFKTVMGLVWRNLQLTGSLWRVRDAMGAHLMWGDGCVFGSVCHLTQDMRTMERILLENIAFLHGWAIRLWSGSTV